MPEKPTLEIEQQYWQSSVTPVAGLDEAGMGALAGPVVAGAVVFDAAGGWGDFNVLIRDSKTLSAKQRQRAAEWIKEQARSWAIGEASVEEITQLNIRQAAHLAMRRAVDQLEPAPALLLIDGNPAEPHPSIPATNIVKGDSVSLSIAAASILAKVHRDELMVQLDAKFPAYGLAQHKGYGSAQHLAALHQHGASPHHRTTYAPVAKVLEQAKT